jgi:hypothetical protein
MSYYTDYPTKPIGGGNPYHQCIYCDRSVPAINGRLDRHIEFCIFRKDMEAKGFKDED